MAALPFEVGAEVCIVNSCDAAHLAEASLVQSTAPLVVAVANRTWWKRSPDRVLVVFQTATQLWRIEALVLSSRLENEVSLVTLEPIRVWEVDRRVAPRYPATIPAAVGFVGDVDGELRYRVVSGETVNVSANGARLRVESPIEPGSVMHVGLKLSADCVINVVAVAPATQTGGEHVSITFLEFFEDGQNELYSFIGRQAA